MNALAPISTIMSTDLKTLHPDDAVEKAKAIFEANNIHHIPVVGFRKILGILSKTDLMHFLRGYVRSRGDELLENTRLKAWKVEEIMQEEVVYLDEDDTMMKALDIFRMNRIHAIPILRGEELVGTVTPHDIIQQVREEAMKEVEKEILTK